MAILAGAQVALRQRVETAGPQRVDQERDLDSVANRKRQRLEQLASPGTLSGQRLGETGQPRLVEVEQRSGHQFGHPAALMRNADRSVAEAAARMSP